MPAVILFLLLGMAAVFCFVGGVFILAGTGPALIAAAPCLLGMAITLRRGMIDG